MRSILVLLAFTQVVSAQEIGVRPRPDPSDYQAHQSTKSATVAAAIVPARQVERMLSAEIARHYVVLEIAVYPQNGQPVEVDRLDFGLKVGDVVTYAEKPRDVATPWPEKNRTSDKPLTVITDTGVTYSHGNDPALGRRNGWGVYEGVGVTNDPRAATPPAPPRQDADPRIVEDRIRETILPEGPASAPVAGYLFFPQYKAKRQKGLELRWSRDGASATLRLPEK